VKALHIDSIDLPNFMTAIHKRLGVNIPEIDDPKLVILEAVVAGLMLR